MNPSEPAATILGAIGNTPLVTIQRLNPNPRVRIMAKLEYFNPGGSVKDRAALFMIEAGERSGQLVAGKTVIEATSGNTGIGLALVCAVKGYKLLLTMSESASEERQKILRARGADILLTPSHLSTDGAIEEAYRLAREYPERYYLTDQFNNDANWKAHYHTTAVEIWRQTGGRISAVVATLGTSGTAMGLARRFRAYDPQILMVGVEPFRGHKVQGLKNMMESYRPEIYEPERLDRKLNIDDETAFEMTRELARKEGLFVGMSSGAAMAAAQALARELDSGHIVVIFPDGGERYLSTPLFDVQRSDAIALYDTASRRKRTFTPLAPGKVSMYVCGPTADAPCRIGQCRRYVVADMLARYFRYRGFEVKQVTNITDYDDKTIEGSAADHQELAAFTRHHIEAFKADLKALGVAPAQHYPKASEHLPEMVALAEKLAEAGAAYEKLRSLYFNISGQKGYGSLSGVDIDKIRVGATVNLDNYEKDNPRDFTLLKRVRLSELKRGIFMRTRWGSVRPSLHLQCTAMAMHYLGDCFDVHVGGRELIFPHHENMTAIAQALTGSPLAQYWVHAEQVRVGDVGDRPEAGAVTLSDLGRLGFEGRVVRYWLLSRHHHKPLLLSTVALENSRKAVARLEACVDMLADISDPRPHGDEIEQLLYDLQSGFTTAMDDDLNTPAAMGVIFKAVRRINHLHHRSEIGRDSAQRLLDQFRRIDSVLQLLDRPPQSDLSPEVTDLIRRRQQARQAQNWSLADRLRDQLNELGVEIRDQKAELP